MRLAARAAAILTAAALALGAAAAPANAGVLHDLRKPATGVLHDL